MKQINVVKLDTVKEDSDEYSRHILAATFLDALRNNGLNLEYLAGELARGNIQDLQIIRDGMWFLGTDEGGLLKELLDRNILTIEEVRSINEVKNKAIQQLHLLCKN